MIQPWCAEARPPAPPSARADIVKRVQRSVQAQFRRLVADSPVHLTAAAVRDALHTSEWCSLQESGVADLIDPGGARLSAADCELARGDWTRGNDRDMAIDEGDPSKAVRPCWVALPRETPRQPNCTLRPENVAFHRTMLSRFSGVAAGSAGSSHLLGRGSAGPLDDGHAVLFYGDSLVWDLFQAARCEALRSKQLERQAKRIHFASVNAWRRLGVRLTNKVNRHTTILPAALAKMGATHRHNAMIVASIGHHYNNHHAAASGLVEAFDVGKRSQYWRELGMLLDVLEAHANRSHPVVLITPALQHFGTWDGSFAPSIHKASGYGCQAGPRHRELFNTTSANFWRASDMYRCAKERAPHVMLVPQHEISRFWWDQHPGVNSHAKSVVRGALFKSTTDCTHFCYSPFLYEPIWWALRQLTANLSKGETESST